MSRANTQYDPHISVVIPVCGEKKYLSTALRSVSNQLFESYEVIIVDDGTDVDYDDVFDRFDLDIQFARHKTNRGAGAARNTGIDESNGEYIAFLDVDDTWRPTKLIRQYEEFKRHDDDKLGLVYTGFEQHEVTGETYTYRPSACGDVYLNELKRDQIHPTSTVMVRRACLEHVGGFDPELPSRQDYDLWIRITERYLVSYVNETLVEKYERANNISKSFDRRIEGDHAVMEKVRERTRELGICPRLRILSYHHHVLGRDYESNGDRIAAFSHLVVAILMYPPRPMSWVMLFITITGVNRNGVLMNRAKKLIR